MRVTFILVSGIGSTSTSSITSTFPSTSGSSGTLTSTASTLGGSTATQSSRGTSATMFSLSYSTTISASSTTPGNVGFLVVWLSSLYIWYLLKRRWADFFFVFIQIWIMSKQRRRLWHFCGEMLNFKKENVCDKEGNYSDFDREILA